MIRFRAAPRWLALLLLFPLMTAAGLVGAGTLFGHASPRQCPVGEVYDGEPGSDADADGGCAPARHPEPFHEMALKQDQRLQHIGVVPAGAYRRALQARQAMIAAGAQTAVAGADGQWTPYGQGPLISNDPRFSSVNSEGYVNLGGRVDSLAYDAADGRLFATTGGTGGVWMSTDLGQHWASVGDALPSQIVGSVGWTSAGGGTLIVAGGDPSFGGGDYAGLGAFWSNDLGKTWHQADGVPDGALGFKVAVDHADPDIVYLAISKGLFRSTDAGRTFTNVALPVSADCAGVTDDQQCEFANFVTDVVVKEPGGITQEAGGAVLAAVGFRAGNTKTFEDGTVESPGNGLYASDTGEPGSFTKLDVSSPSSLLPTGFAPSDRIGRVAFGEATGAGQNHNVVYAIVEDAVLFNGGFPILDLPDGLITNPLNSTLFNGIYVSSDFGHSWMRMADTSEIAFNPATGSALALLGVVTHYSPGVQAYYNLWITPDPTRAGTGGFPTRLLFGLEEVWMNRHTSVALNGLNQIGPNDFKVIGAYRKSLSARGTTTHPDQHAGIFVPDADGQGGVTAIVGNDGGAYAQHVAAGQDFSQDNWGDGANDGFNSLLPYDIAVADDGRVWYGLQDNGSGYIDGTDQKQYMNYGGDGFFVATDPADSDTAYEEYTYGDISVTTDGGQTWSDIAPSLTGAQFANPFVMDRQNPKHLMTAGNQVVETTDGPATTSRSWTQVYALGSAPSGASFAMSALALDGANAYVGYCGVCDILNHTSEGFQNGLATNVGGSAAAKALSSDGWHAATAHGLPNRYITGIRIDPANPSTVYVTLAGYANRQWVTPGSYGDANPNIGSGHVFKSIDAGENFADISGDLPDVNVNAINLRDGQLVIGTDVGAFISSDTDGTQWAPLGTGLPATPIVDLEVAPNNRSLLYVASYGRGVYRYTFADTGGTSGGTSGGTGGGTGGGTSGGTSGGTGGGSSAGGSGSSSSSSGGGPIAPAMLLMLGVAACLRRRAATG